MKENIENIDFTLRRNGKRQPTPAETYGAIQEYFFSDVYAFEITWKENHYPEKQLTVITYFDPYEDKEKSFKLEWVDEE